jgi:opacity protein-like surface antigen
MKKTLACLVLFVSIITMVAQPVKPQPIKRMRVNHFYLQSSLSRALGSIGSISDFNQLAPASQLLTTDFSDFRQRGYDVYGYNSGLHVLMGIQFSDKEKTRYKPNPMLRLGVGFFSNTQLANSLSNNLRMPFDTLQSAQTGEVYLVDSIQTDFYNMIYWSQQLRFDGSFIFRTNPEARLSLFTGVGFTAGFSVMAMTDIYFSRTSRMETELPGGGASSIRTNNDNDSFELESFRNATNFGGSAYIPMGIDFRLGKKNEFLKRIFLNYEFRPAINMTSIPELGTFTNVLTQHNFGIRVSWN